MDIIQTDVFYSRLPVNQIPLGDLFMEDHLFFRMPADWHVVITDVKNSTAAIQNGYHETINLVATASIVAVLNIVYKASLTVPFFFGGDGATFIIPPSCLDKVMYALAQHKENTKTNFNLDLRIGHVPVEDIYQAGHELTVSKFKISDTFTIPVVLGEGLIYAEKKIKGPDYLFARLNIAEDILDLSGMQCRWDRIRPPVQAMEIVSLLAVARSDVKQSLALKKVMDVVEEIYGQSQVRNPITVNRLKMNTTLARVGLELKAKVGSIKALSLFTGLARSVMGYLFFKTKKGKIYLHKLVSMSDTLVIDGRISTVISGTPAQRETLQNKLNQLETDGQIFYGLYVSKESVMSCYVRDLDEGHIHFVDGAEGGYTRAAGVLKAKFASSSVPGR